MKPSIQKPPIHIQLSVDTTMKFVESSMLIQSIFIKTDSARTQKIRAEHNKSTQQDKPRSIFSVYAIIRRSIINSMKTPSARTVTKLANNPLVRRVVAWLAPILIAYVSRKLTEKPSKSKRKYVKNKTK